VGALVRLHRALGRTPGPRTFPATLPLFSLDRIWVVPRSRLQRIWVHRSAAARRASDHLPIVAELRLEPTVSANLVEAGSADPIDRPDHDPPLARSVHFALGKEVSRMDPFVLAPLLVVALGLLYLALSIHGRTGSGTERGDFLSRRESGRVGWALLWLLGVPIPVLLVLFLMRGCT
jgi:hypothetical protein